MFLRLDENLPDSTDTYHDIVGKREYIDPRGRKPRKLTSSWGMHERFPAPPRKPEYWFFLDEFTGGPTLTKVSRLEDITPAIEALREQGYNPVVRPHVINDETLEAEAQERRTTRQLGTYML